MFYNINSSREIFFLVDEFPRIGGIESSVDILASGLSKKGITVTVLARLSGIDFTPRGNYKIKIWSPFRYATRRSAIKGGTGGGYILGFCAFFLKRTGLLNAAIEISEKILLKRISKNWNSDTVLISTMANMLDEVEKIADLSSKKSSKPFIIQQFHTSLNPLAEYGAFVEEVERNSHLIDGMTVLSERCKNSFIEDFDIPKLVLENPNPDNLVKNISNFCNKFVVAARLVENKQVDIAIKAYKNFLEKSDGRYKDWTLEIYGDGPERHNLQILVSELGIADKVIFHGMVGNPSEIFSDAGALLVTSRYEGWSMVIQEAGCYGVPSIVFDVSGGTAELTESLNGILVPPGDIEEFVHQMVKVASMKISNEDACERQELTRQYDVEHVVDKLLTWIDQNHTSIGN